MGEPFHFALRFLKRRDPRKPWDGTFLRATKVHAFFAQLFSCPRQQPECSVKAKARQRQQSCAPTTSPRGRRKSPDQLSRQSCLDLSLQFCAHYTSCRSRQTPSSVTVKAKANERWGRDSGGEVGPCRRFWLVLLVPCGCYPSWRLG